MYLTAILRFGIKGTHENVTVLNYSSSCGKADVHAVFGAQVVEKEFITDLAI